MSINRVSLLYEVVLTVLPS